MKLIQTSFAAGEITPSMYGRVDIQKYSSGAKRLRNVFVHPHGGASNRAGTRYIGSAAGKGRLIPFRFNSAQAYALEFTAGKIRFLYNGGLVTYPSGHAQAGQIVEVATVYAESDLAKIKYTQSADTVFLVHPSYPPKLLIRKDHHVWTFSEMNFNSAPPAPYSFSVTGISPGRQNVRIYYAVTVTINGMESLPVYGSCYRDWTWEAGFTVSLSWLCSSTLGSSDVFKIYKSENGGTYGYIGTSTSRSFTDNNITPATSYSPPVQANPFVNGNYPGTVGIFEQRLFMGRTNSEPQTVFASRSGNFFNFGISATLQDDDAITVAIASCSINEILHFVPMSSLILLTSGAEWLTSHGSNSEALTPSSIQFKPQGYTGANDVQPLIIGNDALFIERSGKAVRDMFYKLESDGYIGSNMSILSEHFFEDYEITDWTYQQIPYKLVWAVREDGKLLSFTFLKEHEVFAWSLHETDGEIESVCSIPNSEKKDNLYLIVKRTVNGQTVRYLEVLAEDRIKNNDIRNAFFVDCGLSYEGDPVSVLSGLDYLEGKTVAILADGNVISGKTVSDGSVTLDYPASKIHIGLPYEATIETLPVALNQAAAFAQTSPKLVNKIHIRLDRTRGLWVGQDDSHLVEAPWRSDEDYNQPTRLFSGDKTLTAAGTWNADGSFVIKQKDPLPVTVLAVIPEVTLGS